MVKCYILILQKNGFFSKNKPVFFTFSINICTTLTRVTNYTEELHIKGEQIKII